MKLFSKDMSYKSEKKKLPDAYQEVEWIGNTRFSYINTDVLINASKIRYELKTYADYTGGSYDGFVIGTNEGYLFLDLYADATRRAWVNYSTSDTILCTCNFNTDYEFNITGENNVFSGTCNGEQITNCTYTTSNTAKLRLFKAHQVGTSFIYRGKIYYFRFYKDDTKVLDLVPCYHKTNGVIGLYDLVNDVFYTNSGTGTFTKGNDVL